MLGGSWLDIEGMYMSMTKAEFLDVIADIVEAESGDLDGSETLKTLDGWDSLARLSLIAVIDKRLKTTLSANSVNECATINDIAALLGDNITD